MIIQDHLQCRYFVHVSLSDGQTDMGPHKRPVMLMLTPVYLHSALPTQQRERLMSQAITDT